MSHAAEDGARQYSKAVSGPRGAQVTVTDNSLKWINGIKSFFISIGEGFSKALAKDGAWVQATRGDAFVTNGDRLCRRVSTILTFFKVAHDHEILAHRSQLVEGRSHWNMLGRSIMFGLSIAILRDGFAGASGALAGYPNRSRK